MIDRLNRTKLIIAIAALALVALVAAACASDDDGGTGGSLGGGFDALSAELARGGFAQSATGIHVTGSGKVTIDPDIATIAMGVEGFAPTVAEARQIAADALTAMLASLSANGVPQDDVRTTFFNIQPEYEWREVIEGGIRKSERVLAGYRVTNSLIVTVRDLDRVGDIVDGLAIAGGDATRINGITFDIEDRTAAQDQARLLALRDAVAKADVYASETGVSRGKLVFVTETSFAAPRAQPFTLESAADAALAGAPTPIIAGDLDVLVTVSAVFAID